MAGQADNEISIDAPIGFVWDVTNDMRSWPDLFTDYSSVDLLDETPTRVRFRLTTHPDEYGRVWSWVSERSADRATWTVRAWRLETGPFEYLHIEWHFREPEPGCTVMRWRHEFAMRPDVPVSVEDMVVYFNRSAAIQMSVIKRVIELRRLGLVDAGEVAPDRRCGGDLRILLSPRTVGSTHGLSGLLRLSPGEVFGEHYHPYSDEFLHVTDGRVRVDLDGVPRVLTFDQALHVPINVRHRLANAGTDPAIVVFFLTPLAPSIELGHVVTESPVGTGSPVPTGEP